MFVGRCAGCHGSDGNGGELGPGIATRVPTRTDQDLTTLFRQGLPGAGMPAFANPGGSGTGDLVRFLRTLRPRAGSGPERGNGHVAGGRPRLEASSSTAARSTCSCSATIRSCTCSARAATRIARRDVADRLDELQRPDERQPLQSARANQQGQRGDRSRRNGSSACRTPNNLQVTPVVADGVMYVTSANECYALDAGAGREIWHYQRPRTKGLVGNAAGGVNRGVGVAGDRVFMVTDHAHRHRAQPPPARCSGKPRWPTGTRTTTPPARRCRSATSSSPARPAATKACADSWPRSIRRPAKKCGASGPCRSAASRDRRRGRAKASIIRAARRG